MRSAADLLSEPSAVLQELRSFKEMGSVLYVAAHPDDENTQLITYLARGRNYRTAYLSLTRGDGGQNVLGSDFDEKLGVARTQELLEARKMDGGQQFFTRAIDFGFSKDYRETLRIWNKEAVLSDVVRVIRIFRPDVIITRFSPQPGGTHGHHTASAVLALEAFKLSGDPKAFPDQLKDLEPWQAKRIFVNGRGGEGLRMEIDGDDVASGRSLNELATASRAMHKTQGFDNFRGYGGGSRGESFHLLDGEPATSDILEGVNTTWSRLPGGKEIDPLAAQAISQFDSNNPAAIVPTLLQLRSQLAKIATNSVILEKRLQLDRIVAACLGLKIQTTIPNAELVSGEELKLTHSVKIGTDAKARWIAVRYPEIKREIKTGGELREGKSITRESVQTLPKDTPLTQPYWLRGEPAVGIFHVSDPSLIGRPENPPVFPVEFVFEINGQEFTLPDEPVQLAVDENQPRRLDVIPPVSLRFASAVSLFAPGAAREVTVEVTANRSGLGGDLALDIPKGWKVSPAKQTFEIAKAGERFTVQFTVTAPKEVTTAKLIANAKVGGVTYRNAREEVHYWHFPLQLLQPAAATKAVSVNVITRGKRIGYVPGAGDDIPASLVQMGCEVVMLNHTNLAAAALKELDAVVLGVRAFDVHPGLEAQASVLFNYAEQGGTVVAQYNRSQSGESKIAPYKLRLSRDRVTDENAKITFLAPDHPVLNVPNKITADDFSGWVQERGVYFANEWAEQFTPILEAGDPDSAPLQGGLLIAKHGKGYFVYTGLAFFRQLPAGVPGAYRLFANLISLGE